MKKSLFALTGLAACATLVFAAAPAMARVNVDVHIGVPGGYYVQPAPVYVQPAPVYVHPRPVYVNPQPVYVHPAPVYVQPAPLAVDRYPSHRHHHAPYGYRDRDGDGVPNRWDRRPENPYRH